MLCLTSVLSQGWMQLLSVINFCFTFHLLFLCCAICHFSWKKHHTTLKTVPSIHISWRRASLWLRLPSNRKKPPPSFSLRCKLIGLCWLLWRYCLWWLPLAIFILGRCLDSPCSTAWRVTVATMNCVWCVVSFLLLFCPGFNPCKHWSITVTLPQHL